MKKQTIIIIILIIGFIGFLLINLNTVDNLFNAEMKIIKIESEKVELKKDVEKLLIEVTKNKKIAKKYKGEKNSIAKSWDLDTKKNVIIVKSLQKRLKMKGKPEVIYKESPIKKTDSQGRLYNFGMDAVFTLKDYREIDLLKESKTNKVIKDLELSIDVYKLIGKKSEKIIDVQELCIKKIKKKNKLIIAGSILAIITTIFLLK